jgi:hypothetical protein
MSADPSLFDLLEPAPSRPPLEEPRLGAVGTKWTRWTGVHRPCDHCVQRIHERGVAGAPPPAPARHKRVGPNDTLWLCAEDAEEMKRKDDEVTAERDRRVRAAEEAKRAAIRAAQRRRAAA